MYAAYQLKGFESADYSELARQIQVGRELEKTANETITRSIRQFVKPDGSVDAASMMEEWFPDTNANVFISHSRADEELAFAIAGILNEMGLHPFIDSCVWSHADTLLWAMDKKWCPIVGTESFSYEKRNVTTAHVHLMLSTALTKMMDRCECIFFLNTANSVRPRSPGEMVTGDDASTHSPWLFHEIAMMKLLRRRKKEKHWGREELTNFSEGTKKSAASVPQFRYPADLGGVPELDLSALGIWVDYLEKHDDYPLDLLYHVQSPHA